MRAIRSTLTGSDGRLAQPLVDRVEDPPPRLLGAPRPGGAARTCVSPRVHHIHLTRRLAKDRLSDEMNSPQIPILISGAGPAGLAAAIELARRGVEVLVVDRRPSPQAFRGRRTISTRSMELIRSWASRTASRRRRSAVEWTGCASPTLAAAAEGRSSDRPPDADAGAVISPCAPACVAQDELEQILVDHLRSLGTARSSSGPRWSASTRATRSGGCATSRAGVDRDRARPLHRRCRRRAQRRPVGAAASRSAAPTASATRSASSSGARSERARRRAPRHLLGHSQPDERARSSPPAGATAGSTRWSGTRRTSC